MYLELGGVVQSACCHWGELGAWSRWMTTPPGPVVVVAAAVEGDGGGRGDDGIDSAHYDPGGIEMGGALLLAVAGATAGAVTFSKSHFLHNMCSRKINLSNTTIVC